MPGEETRQLIVEEIEKQRSKPVDFMQKNVLTTVALALLGGGSLGGVTVDEFFGGSAARAERDAQVALIVEASEKAAEQYQAQIDRLEDDYERLDARGQELKALYLECNEARLEERVSTSTETLPPSALEAIE